jgi:hypothetical protein
MTAAGAGTSRQGRVVPGLRCLRRRTMNRSPGAGRAVSHHEVLREFPWHWLGIVRVRHRPGSVAQSRIPLGHFHQFYQRIVAWGRVNPKAYMRTLTATRTTQRPGRRRENQISPKAAKRGRRRHNKRLSPQRIPPTPLVSSIAIIIRKACYFPLHFSRLVTGLVSGLSSWFGLTRIA